MTSTRTSVPVLDDWLGENVKLEDVPTWPEFLVRTKFRSMDANWSHRAYTNTGRPGTPVFSFITISNVKMTDAEVKKELAFQLRNQAGKCPMKHLHPEGQPHG